MATAKTAAKPAKTNTTTHARLRTQYNDKFAAELLKELELDNIHRVPRLEKIVVNVGLVLAKDDK